jgi:hypothetical protein
MRRGRLARGSQGKRRCKTKPTTPRKKSKPPEKPVPPGSPFKKRPCGPVLKGRQPNPPASGAAAAGCGPVSFRPRLVTSILHYKSRYLVFLSQRQVFSRGLYRRMLPHAGEFRPLRRATRRCPPWTRTGLCPVTERLTGTGRWVLGMVLRRQKPRPPRSVKGRGIAPPCTHLVSRHPPSPSHTVKPRSGG